MLIDRYEPVDLFALVPKLYADFEPELRELDKLLDDDIIFTRLKQDLAGRSRHSLTRGRRGTPVEVILRMLVVKRLYDWSYEETEHFVADSLVLRQFCRIYLEAVPDDTTLIRWANQIKPETLAALNERVVELAKSLKVTRGRKLRVDSTVVETNIHYPTDSGLLNDGVRVVSRLLRRAKELLGEAAELGKKVFRSRSKSAQRLAQQLHRLVRAKSEDAKSELKETYSKLLAVAEASCKQAEQVYEVLKASLNDDAQRLAAKLSRMLPLVKQVIDQTRRRVLLGESVPAKEKLLSLFEPHTQIIQRGKAGKAVEFGKKLWLEEVEGGIISGYRLLDEAGPDYHYFEGALADHDKRFGKAPHLVAGDRGVFTPANERLAEQAGVKRVVLPAKGRASNSRRDKERQPWFKRGLRFRAGCEGRISVLKRCYGLDCCLDHGEAGMGCSVGWGIVTHNLAKIAQTVAARAERPGLGVT